MPKKATSTKMTKKETDEKTSSKNKTTTKITSQKETTKKEVAKKETTKKELPKKEVAKKENTKKETIKKQPAEKKKTTTKTITTNKVKEENINNVNIDKDIKALTMSYSFLLSTLIIFLISLESFKLNLFGNDVSLAIFIIPFVYFLIDVILKEIGLKPAIVATGISIVVLLLTTLITDSLFNVEFNLLRYIGVLLGYSLSQFLNISIYYYMLSNFKTPLFLVLLNLVFVLLVNNMISMFFGANMILTNSFWASYTIIICLQTLISMILAIFLNLIEQGLEV